MRLYACCGLQLCPAYPQHFAHGSVDKIPGYPGRAGTLTGLHPMQVCRCRRLLTRSRFVVPPPRAAASGSHLHSYAVARLQVRHGLMEAACERRIPMPNWCSNRMYFSGEPAQIAEIKRLASGAVTPLYRRATNEGIQLFLTGSAGLLQTTEDVRFEPCPGLTAAGRGVVSPENIAFIDRNLNPKKIKKTPQNGCLFNTACVP